MALNPLLKKLVTQSAAKYKGTTAKSIKPKEGRNIYRFIVPKPGEVSWVGADGLFFRELGVHWIKSDPAGKAIAVVGSEEICYQRVSALAAAIDMAIANAYDEDSKKLYQEWKARRSIVCNVVSRETGNSVDVLELTPTTFSKVMDIANLYDDSGVDIFDHQMGMDIVITKAGKGLNTSYDVAVVPLAPGKTFAPVTQDQINQTTDLDNWIQVNYFRGEEQKALNAVAQIAGIAVPQIGHMTATPVAALTSSAATVAGATVQAPAVVPQTPAAAVAAAGITMTAAEMQAEIQRQAAMMVQQQNQQAALAAAAAAATISAPTARPAAVVTAETPISDLGQDEQDALLAELNSIGN
jgi:hypothetical protein